MPSPIPLPSAVGRPGCPIGDGRPARPEGRPNDPTATLPPVAAKTLHEEADDFLALFATETGKGDAWRERRMGEVCREIAGMGSYRHTFAELKYGARVSWRNSARCVGRLFWESLEVWDRREARTAEEIARTCFEHIVASTSGGDLRPLLTVFPPGPRLWNSQLIRYAGYVREDGTVLGDPLQIALTRKALELGWEKLEVERTPFDVLPLIVETPAEGPRLFPLPEGIVLEVALSHPDFPWFADLKLKWHALPAIADLRMEIGGISYTAAPSSGWYVSHEIGARNLADEGRYNLLPVIADRMRLSRKGDKTLWRDRALVELNVAVLHSFERAGVKIVDHHTVSKQFVAHLAREAGEGRTVPAEWSWVVPPLSGAQSQTYHRAYENVALKPNFFPQPSPF